MSEQPPPGPPGPGQGDEPRQVRRGEDAEPQRVRHPGGTEPQQVPHAEGVEPQRPVRTGGRRGPGRAAIAIVPVKPLDSAKSRLASVLAPEERQRLMLAMLSDVLLALRRCDEVYRVVVVTDDRDARHRAEAEGAEVVPDGPASSHAGAALRGIAAAASPTDRVLLVPADCPLLDPAELDSLIAARQPPVVVIPDRHGTGTNALLLSPPDVIDPAFGEGSCARHVALARAEGVEPAVTVVPSLALDIDTPDDLATLRARLKLLRGGASSTRGAIAGLGG